MNKNSANQTHNNKNGTTANANFQTAAGRIPYNMTNDYMFRAVFQSSNEALRGLICSLLHLSESEVVSVDITNPIMLGESIDNKAFHLDIHLLLNDSTRINLATEEDKRYHIDSWARLFKADTWEELRMTASEDAALYEAAKALFYRSSDEEIRMRCLDREEYYQDLRNYERVIAETKRNYERDLAAQAAEIAKLRAELALAKAD